MSSSENPEKRSPEKRREEKKTDNTHNQIGPPKQSHKTFTLKNLNSTLNKQIRGNKTKCSCL